jgi:hypothetical protein
VISLVDDWEKQKPEKLLDVLYSRSLNLYILGKYENDDNPFQGTDRLSMAVQPDAVSFIQNNRSKVLFEGDRLFNSKFIDEILKVTEDFRILVLTAPQQTIDQRHVDRKDNQSDQFKNGRKTNDTIKFSNNTD